MKWSDQERYLKPIHLNNQRVVVTIDRVTMEDTHPRPGKTERAPVLYFKGKEKGFICSTYNARTLARLFGDDCDACLGKQIALKVVEVLVGRETKRPIRIFAAEPATPTEALKEATATARVN